MTNEEIIAEIRRGRRELLEDLYQQNKGIIAKLSRMYSYGDRENEQDLQQELACQLFECADKFIPAKGVSFFSFAYPQLRSACIRYLDGQHMVRLPRDRLAIIQPYRELKAAGFADVEIMRKLRITRSRLEGLQSMAALIDTPVSLSVPLDGGEGDGAITLADTLQAPGDAFTDVEAALEAAEVRRLVTGLPEPHRAVIYMRFADEMGQSEIAEALGVTVVDVRRYIRQACAMLRKQIHEADVIESRSFSSSRVRRFRSGVRTSVVEEIVLDRIGSRC